MGSVVANKLQKQLIELENDLYAAIFPLLSSYETRGFNAHQRAQTIAHNTRLDAEHWIGIQHQPENKMKVQCPECGWVHIKTIDKTTGARASCFRCGNQNVKGFVPATNAVPIGSTIQYILIEG